MNLLVNSSCYFHTWNGTSLFRVTLDSLHTASLSSHSWLHTWSNVPSKRSVWTRTAQEFRAAPCTLYEKRKHFDALWVAEVNSGALSNKARLSASILVDDQELLTYRYDPPGWTGITSQYTDPCKRLKMCIKTALEVKAALKTWTARIPISWSWCKHSATWITSNSNIKLPFSNAEKIVLSTIRYLVTPLKKYGCNTKHKYCGFLTFSSVSQQISQLNRLPKRSKNAC
jgi:hypothetical protein